MCFQVWWAAGPGGGGGRGGAGAGVARSFLFE